MNYKETGFRALYKRFAVFMITDERRKLTNLLPDNDKADCMLAYGYIDHDAGMTMEIIAAGKKHDNAFSFYDSDASKRLFMRIGSLENDKFYLLDDKDNRLSERYSEKLRIVNDYYSSDDIEESRKMGFLDELRHEYYPDDITVILTAEGIKPEVCWVRIEGLGNRSFYGRLLNEPYQEFGCHQGDMLNFYAQKTDGEKIICFTDTAKDIRRAEDGKSDGKDILKEAVSKFNGNRDNDNFVNVLKILNYSHIWVPCNAILSENDQAALNKAAEAGEDISKLIGQTFTNSDNIRMVPDILQNGDKFFFPVFSSAEEMGEYGEHFSKVEQRFLDVIPLARNNEKEIAGIVLNAFKEPFVVDKDLFDIFKEYIEKDED